eukprot:3509229-Pleurochrysis_carterae.AAC.1
MAAVNVFRALMMLRVVGQADSGFIVQIADLLSKASDVGSQGARPRSVKRERRYTASLVASEAAIISASQDDRATDGCFLDAHEMAA